MFVEDETMCLLDAFVRVVLILLLLYGLWCTLALVRAFVVLAQHKRAEELRVAKLPDLWELDDNLRAFFRPENEFSITEFVLTARTEPERFKNGYAFFGVGQWEEVDGEDCGWAEAVSSVEVTVKQAGAADFSPPEWANCVIWVSAEDLRRLDEEGNRRVALQKIRERLRSLSPRSRSDQP